jgi:hypothetical protein
VMTTVFWSLAETSVPMIMRLVVVVAGEYVIILISNGPQYPTVTSVTTKVTV